MIKKIITLGPKFSYSYNVALAHYSDLDIEPVSTIDEVFTNISKQNVRGIVPIENMLNGSVRETFLSLQKNDVHIFKGYDYTIAHVLASKSEKFSTVMSHAQALVQCSEYVKSLRDKGISVVESPSTSRAMELASEDENIAAIGSPDAVEHYKLRVIKKNISNKDNNVTRFIEIGIGNFETKGKKTSVIVTPKTDRSGLLFEILSVFKIKDLNLTKIESIPTGEKMNDYIFYIDIEGDMQQQNMKDAIDFLQTFVDIAVLGSYNILE